MLLVVDNGSVFTKNLQEILTSCNARFKSVRCADVGPPDGFDSVILSGRRVNDSRTNVPNSRIIRHCVSEGKPLLGICYGAEILALTMGGTLRRSDSLRVGLHSIQVSGQSPIPGGRLLVFESHRFEIARMSDPVVCIASSPICRYEMIWLRDSRIFGTQFHPEATQDGRRLIEKFLEL